MSADPALEVLLVGYNDLLLTALDDLPDVHVTVVEEPDLWSGKGLATRAARHPCLGPPVLARYQQDDDYRRLLTERPAPDAVVPGLEYAVEAAADLAEGFGLPGVGRPAAHVLRDKLALREALVGSGLREVRAREVSSAQEVAAFVAEVGPSVLKPAGRQASLGVVLLDSPDEAPAAWSATTLADEGRQVAGRTMRWRYLVEERLRGPEVSVECLVADGHVVWANLTRKSVLPGPAPVEAGHVVGHPVGRWAEHMQRLVDVVGVRTALLHAEWIGSEDGAALVECAARPPGDRITRLLDLAYEDDVHRHLVRTLSGRTSTPRPHPTRGAAIRFLSAAHEGVLAGVTGVEAARALRGVDEVSVTAAPGTPVGPPSSSWSRLGHVVALAAGPEEADRRARAALEALEVEVDPVPSGGHA